MKKILLFLSLVLLLPQESHANLAQQLTNWLRNNVIGTFISRIPKSYYKKAAPFVVYGAIGTLLWYIGKRNQKPSKKRPLNSSLNTRNSDIQKKPSPASFALQNEIYRAGDLIKARRFN